MQHQTNIPIKHEQQPNFDFSLPHSHPHTHSRPHMPRTHSCANTSRIACSHLGLHAAATSGRCSSCFWIESSVLRSPFSVPCSLCSLRAAVIIFFFLVFLLFSLFGVKVHKLQPPCAQWGLNVFAHNPNCKRQRPCSFIQRARGRKVIALATR